MLHDLRCAARCLRRSPGFAAAAILSLAIGIGGNIAIFSIINAALIKPLEYPNADRLLVIRAIIPKNPLSKFVPSLPVKVGIVRQWRHELQSFESIGAATGSSMTIAGDGQAEKLDAVIMTAEFLDVLGAKPQLGRWFTPADEADGSPNVVILSHSLWRERFSSDPRILGGTILLDGKPHHVVGITAASMPFPQGELRRWLPKDGSLFLPLRPSKADMDVTSNRTDISCVTIARLMPGVTMNAAHSELEVSMAGLSRINRRGFEMHAHIEPLQAALVGESRKGLLVLSGAVGFVLLIVCVNVANLTLVRATGRRQELAVRAALGAGRRHLISVSLAESMLIASIGTLYGLILAWWLVDLVIAAAPPGLSGLRETTLDGYVLLFAICLCLLTAVLFGLFPAWRIARVPPLGLLHQQSRGSTEGPRGGRLHAILVSAEVALGTVLLIGAGLLLGSLHRVMKVPRGFEVENVIAVDLSVPTAKYQTFEERLSFFRRVEEGVSTISGISQMSYTNRIPLSSGGDEAPPILEGRETTAWENTPMANWWHVDGAYFSTMGVALTAGRLFIDKEEQPVAIVSETAANRLWPGENPIGKRFRHIVDPIKNHWFEVIGVVRDVRVYRLELEPPASIYLPYWQAGCCRPRTETLTLVARTTMPAKALAVAIRQQVAKVDSQVATPEFRTLTGIVSAAVAQRRFQTMMLTAFAIVATLLAAIGVYGVLAYSVAQRRAEIGIRIALGAEPRDVLSLMLLQGMRPVVIGVAIGLIAAAGVNRVLASLLFEVKPLDPLTFAAVPVLLSLIAVLACYFPARQAAVIDPVTMLRQE